MLNDIVWYAADIFIAVCCVLLLTLIATALSITLKSCYKGSLGYPCRHRTRPDGSKECGERP